MTALTPTDAWTILREGNERFVAGTPQHPRQDVERRHELAHVQHPVAVIFGCSDSRLAAEIIFDLGLGDSFVVRNAGQVSSPSVIGSLEYAVGILNVPLMIVLGHDECGAVRAAIDSQAKDATPLPPHIAALIAPIEPAVRRVAVADGQAIIDPTRLDASHVGAEHVRDTIADVLRDSELVAAAVAEGRLGIVGANYRLIDGAVQAHTVLGLAS